MLHVITFFTISHVEDAFVVTRQFGTPNLIEHKEIVGVSSVLVLLRYGAPVRTNQQRILEVHISVADPRRSEIFGIDTTASIREQIPNSHQRVLRLRRNPNRVPKGASKILDIEFPYTEVCSFYWF